MADGLQWPDDVLDVLRKFRQGDIVSDVPFIYYGALDDGGLPLDYPEDGVGDESSSGEPDVGSEGAFVEREFDPIEWDPPGCSGLGVITTQTCDLNEEGVPQQPWFQVSPLRRLRDEHADRTPPSFAYRVNPPDLEPGAWVVDLRIEVSLEKTFLVGREPQRAFVDEADAIRFADALGRRRDRAAMSRRLVDAVSGPLRGRRRNNAGFRRMLRDRVHSVRLRVEEGTRSEPVAVCVHVITRGPLDDFDQERFEKWWDEAREKCADASINLLPTTFHDGAQMDVEILESTIRLDLG